MNYYRIKQIDLNGKSSFSPVASVNFDSEQLLRITNFDQRSIRISGIEGDASLQIFDVNGKVVAFRQINNNDSYDFENLRNGVYFCKAENKKPFLYLKIYIK
ncbi:MAG: T9SS type A sorting domain-containing protein [Saprospiraceae bacterium]|nr:T9SS type A sorting domain-containing protein [Candidatus Brachybacter algidus]